jgi:outer membrane protein assembly factor BamB
MNTNNNISEPALQKVLRLWPGVVIVILQWLVRFVIPVISTDTIAIAIGVFGGLLGGLALVVWWVFFSRAPRLERWGAIILMIVALFATSLMLHVSVKTSMMGMMFVVYAIPVLSLAFVVWAVASRRFSVGSRRATMVATIILASGFWVFLRTNWMTGEARHDFSWRWAKTAEEKLLSRTSDKLVKLPLDPAAMATEAEWPGFRGQNRDGIIHGVRIETDWLKFPPVEMWRRSVGPGCSSFAVHGVLFFTQEQRGDYEMVTCYSLNTGDPVWKHSDKVRFWDAHAGAGPRSTPTLSKGRVYTLGATGILNVLDEVNGAVVWSRDAAGDAKVKTPGWGYTSSPLVVDSVVIIAMADKILAYDLVKGNLRWSGSDSGESYSSPQLFTLDGIRQVLFMNNEGATSYSPSDGKILWRLSLIGTHIVQPSQISKNDILIDAGSLKGMRRLAIKNESGKWTIEERWSSTGYKPFFSDYVIHKGNVFGLEGLGMVCIDIEKGSRKWKGGRNGGQLILLADQDLLLVLSEKGDLALVKATPVRYIEVGRFPAINGKTWNHPVMVGNILLVRNTSEMVAFRLSRARS